MRLFKHIVGLVSNSRDKSYLFWKNLLGCSPTNLQLYKTALIHASLSHKKGESNERLEFLGDAVLDMVMADLLYETYPTATEGEMTQKRTELVKRKNLNALADQMGLTVRVRRLNRVGGEDMGGNALEAVIGALYKDKGYKVCKQFIKRNIFDVKPCVSATLESKQSLVVWCQKNHKQLEYKLLKEERITDNKHVFVVAVEIDGVEMAQAVGQNKKEAQRRAAEQTLKRLNKFFPKAK